MGAGQDNQGEEEPAEVERDFTEEDSDEGLSRRCARQTLRKGGLANGRPCSMGLRRAADAPVGATAGQAGAADA